MGLFSKLKKVHKAIKPGGKASPVGLVRNATRSSKKPAQGSSVPTKPMAMPTRAGGSQPLSRGGGGGGGVRGKPTPTGWMEGPAKPSKPAQAKGLALRKAYTRKARP